MTQQIHEDASRWASSNGDEHEEHESSEQCSHDGENTVNPVESPQGTVINFLKQVREQLYRLAPWLWALVIIVVILPKIGELFIARSFEGSLPDRPQSTEVSANSAELSWEQTEALIVKALRDAHQSADDYAAQRLDTWTDDLISRVDSSFLDWYFSYFNQKEVDYKGFFAGLTANVARWLNPNSQAPQERIAEVITEDFQTEFAKRVLRPQIAQFQLERITEQTVKHYLDELSLNISSIPEQQNISTLEWDQYLSQLSLVAQDVDGTKINLPFKALLGTGGYVLAKPLILPLIPMVSSKVAVSLGSGIGAKIAAKSGAAIAGKVGSTFLDATVGVGILLWDIWDVHHTAAVEKPIMRSSLVDYLNTLSDSLLNNPDTGVMSVVDHVEEGILQGIRTAQSITSTP